MCEFNYLHLACNTLLLNRWTKGHVALLGDSAHAMQPNLGQGGCMAIEDGYQLSTDLAEAVAKVDGYPDIEAVLKVGCPLFLPEYTTSYIAAKKARFSCLGIPLPILLQLSTEVASSSSSGVHVNTDLIALQGGR